LSVPITNNNNNCNNHNIEKPNNDELGQRGRKREGEGGQEGRRAG